MSKEQKKIVIFTGPSLSHEEARKIFSDPYYMPPIKRGDAIKAFKEGASIMGIIDGLFFQDVAISPRELLHLLDRGVIIVGGGSMGALRAAELDVYGMIGVGEIYKMYKRGEIYSDDEVALIFNPHTLEPLSEPLVNIRCTFKNLINEGVLSCDVAVELLEIARSLHYSQRSYERILELAVNRGIINANMYGRIISSLKILKVDQKKLDAIEVVKKVKEITSLRTTS
ncbi:MAG: TfuA-related McrA-glycine thioamidation protein [Candidatus Nezhaarchaeota archaeon]|nr:TfuA-related McrA-glycine thioamidation protein [Candidatus Nezhaarchaeota archaeon]MCX8141653.1 TfuA-related McrA-glycine thioamidation protein [Candidatus Nezhaarchaeota archaeon]MDW8049920.1 TfuA-related McrA-glycine thioamidation protein [Nitrososphaerota archaeon]